MSCLVSQHRGLQLDECESKDVTGGGAEGFCSPDVGGDTYMDRDYYEVFEKAGYKLVFNNTELQAAGDDQRTLGIFSTSNMAKWQVSTPRLQ